MRNLLLEKVEYQGCSIPARRNKTRVAEPIPLGYAGQTVPGVPEMPAACIPRCVPRNSPSQTTGRGSNSRVDACDPSHASASPSTPGRSYASSPRARCLAPAHV